MTKNLILKRVILMSDVIKQIKDVAADIHKIIKNKKHPSLNMPIRSLQNVSYDPKKGYFELIGKMKERTLTASTVKTFAQTLLMMNESKKLINANDIATKREVYYISKNWGGCKIP